MGIITGAEFDSMFGGMQIFVNDTMTGEHVKRSWWQRLFSWPWTPWKPTRFNPHGGKPLMEDGQVLRFGNDKFIMNSRTKSDLINSINKEPDHE